MKFSLSAQIEEVDRELDQRSKVYPRLIAKREMRESIANMHVARLEAVRATLVWLQANETTIKQKVAEATPGVPDAETNAATAGAGRD